jgi:hypothetical protein
MMSLVGVPHLIRRMAGFKINKLPVTYLPKPMTFPNTKYVFITYSFKS